MEYYSTEPLRTTKTHLISPTNATRSEKILAPSILVKPIPSQVLSFNIANVDDLFPGFVMGDFAVLYGSPTVLSLSLLLTVRAQLPFQLGGLETKVVFVDGGNTFRLYHVSRIAQLSQLDPKQVLERILISRAFTAYQMTAIVLEKLKETVDKFDSRLVIISDIAGLYLDKDIPPKEAKDVFNQLTIYLSRFAEENQLIVLATYLPYHPSRRNAFLQEVARGRANVVMFVKSTKFGQQLVLEKHPLLSLGYAAFPSENLTIDQFTGGRRNGKNSRVLSHCFGRRDSAVELLCEGTAQR